MSTNRDIDHFPQAPLLADTLASQERDFPRVHVRGEVGTWAVTYPYKNASGERVVDCAREGRRLAAVTLDRLEP